jgi:hypothetical protein
MILLYRELLIFGKVIIGTLVLVHVLIHIKRYRKVYTAVPLAQSNELTRGLPELVLHYGLAVSLAYSSGKEGGNFLGLGLGSVQDAAHSLFY